MPIGGNWKTLLRVQDGRMLTAAPIFLPADPAIDAEEVPASAEVTRGFVPEIEILQRERELDTTPILWSIANAVVLICSLAILAGICASVARVSGAIAAEGQRRRSEVTAGAGPKP